MRTPVTELLRYFRPGDWFVLVLAFITTGYSVALIWFRPPAEQLVMRSNGTVVARATLDKNAQFVIHGALGDTVIAVEAGRARVSADPSPRQICVQQGWLSRAGDIALCLPNRTSIELAGNEPWYDSLNY